MDIFCCALAAAAAAAATTTTTTTTTKFNFCVSVHHSRRLNKTPT
jgi:hypothetical protein